MNLMKSFFGGLGIRLRQEHIESSSEPKPLYGGISRGGKIPGGALYLMPSKESSFRESRRACQH